MDVLSDALRVIRLKGALFLHAEFGEPWCVAAPRGAELGRGVWPARQQVAICHLVVEGRCWVALDGREALALEAGDAVVLPQGHAHLLGSGLRHAPPSAGDAVHLELPSLARARYGGRGAGTVVVCGWFAYERNVASPIMAALPPVFRSRLRGRSSAAWLEPSIRYAVEEASSARPGAGVVADKLAEVLFVEALRGYVEGLPERQTGWLAALRDAVVARGIGLLHERPAEAWTVASLARAVNVSRTVLAERFAALIGVPPMQYLTQWRVSLAARLLRDSTLTLSRIAQQVGYESEAAFSRAFKREYGLPPGAWRRRR